MIRLSNSSVDKYNQCPKKWELHYKERIRPEYTGSALFFGGACDEAFNRLLLEKKKNLTEEEKLLKRSSAEEVFKTQMSTININNEDLNYLDIMHRLRFFKSDCDVTLLDAIDRKAISSYAEERDIEINPLQIEQFVEEFHQMLKNKVQPEQDEQSIYNLICWYSLYRKGLMMISAYESEIMPQIHEVYDIQKKVELEDGEDTYIGYIDFIASFTDAPDEVYIIDNKTSSRKYAEDSVRTSQQLASYCEYMQTNKAAYIVVEKKLRKREPKVRVQIIKDTIPEKMFDEVFDKISEVFYNIQEESFPMIKDDQGDKACFFFGKPCEYYNYCRNGDMNNLTKLGENNE